MTFEKRKLKILKRELRDGVPHYEYRYGAHRISRVSTNAINRVQIWGTPPLPLDVEYGILESFGFDLDRPIEESQTTQADGGIHCFSQEPDLSPGSLDIDTNRIPDLLYMAISLQATAKGISRKDYVNNLRDMLDMAFDNKYCPGDEETAEHIREIREHFTKRPTKWRYFEWLYEREATSEMTAFHVGD